VDSRPAGAADTVRRLLRAGMLAHCRSALLPGGSVSRHDRLLAIGTIGRQGADSRKVLVPLVDVCWSKEGVHRQDSNRSGRKSLCDEVAVTDRKKPGVAFWATVVVAKGLACNG